MHQADTPPHGADLLMVKLARALDAQLHVQLAGPAQTIEKKAYAR